MTALIESHTPEFVLDEEIDDRPPDPAALTTGVEQQDGRPGADFLPVQDCIRAGDAPRPGCGEIGHDVPHYLE
nr:hypothetical protein [Nocardia terpenica]